jgi:hypothetical protein
MMLRDRQDAYGHLVLDYLKKGRGQEIVEREDGLLDPSRTLPGYYFGVPKLGGAWAQSNAICERKSLGHQLWGWQSSSLPTEEGLDVSGIDVSPLAVKVCKLRGLKKVRVLSISNIGVKLGKFDTLLMFGNNFGLFGSFSRARWLLRRLYEVTSDDARIIAESTDPYKTRDPAHLAYQKLNRSKGRMSGQVRIRVRYRTYMTPWFDYLLAPIILWASID